MRGGLSAAEVHRLFVALQDETGKLGLLLLLLSFFTFGVLVANSRKLLSTVANPARGLLNRKKSIKR